MTRNTSIINEIKSRLSVKDYFERNIGSLTDKGNGEYRGASSSLSKSGASLKVDAHNGFFTDFANRIEGHDIFDLIAYKHNLDVKNDFPEILQIAAEEAGVELQELSEEQKQKAHEVKKVQDQLTDIAEVYHKNLTKELYDYIEATWGITAATVDKYRIGYAKEDNFKGIANKSEWDKTGLLIRNPDGSRGEFFRKRIMFPYWQGEKVVYFTGRGDVNQPIGTFCKDPTVGINKYTKLPTHSEAKPYISENIDNRCILGADSVKGKNFCIITEGVADTYVLLQNEYSAISPGTVSFASADVEELLKITKHCEVVYICNDNEDSKAGENGAIKTGKLLKDNGIDAKIVMLPKIGVSKMDVAEYFKIHNKIEFERLLKDSKDILEHLLEKVALSDNSSTVTAKTENMKAASKFIKDTLGGIKEEEALLFIKNNIKCYFPKFTNDDCKALIKVYKGAAEEEENKRTEGRLPFDLDSESGRSLMTHALTSEILKHKNIIYVAGALRVYDKGVYELNDNTANKLGKEIMQIALNDYGTPIMEKHVKNVFGVLSLKQGKSLAECGKEVSEIAVNNGILNLKTFELREFTPEKIFFNKLPVSYIPDAPEPVQFLKLIEDTFQGNETACKVMQEIFGYCLLDSYKYQVIIYLLGDGGNGKGTLTQILVYMLGTENCSSASLFQLTDHSNSDYYTASLHGKKANICGDIGDVPIKNTEAIKRLSSGTDYQKVRSPYGQPFDLYNTAKLIFALNKMPTRNAFTTGEKRRDLTVEFRNKIGNTEQDIKGLAEMIRDSGEMSGVLNWAIEGLKRLEANQGFSDNKTTAQKGIDYDKRSNPMKYFVEDCIEAEPLAQTKIADIYAAYSEYRKKDMLPELSQEAIKKDLKVWVRELDNVEVTIKRANTSEKPRPTVCYGVRLIKETVTLNKFSSGSKDEKESKATTSTIYESLKESFNNAFNEADEKLSEKEEKEEEEKEACTETTQLKSDISEIKSAILEIYNKSSNVVRRKHELVNQILAEYPEFAKERNKVNDLLGMLIMKNAVKGISD